MGVELVLGHLDHRHRDVGAVVGNALVAGEQVIQHEAVLDGAGAGLQAGDVPRLDLPHQTVHHLLQRLDLARRVAVGMLEGVHGAVHDVLHGGLQHAQIVQSLLAELDALVPNLLGGLDEVDGMVADAFKIVDGVQQRVDAAQVLMGQPLAGQLDQIGAQNVLVMIHRVLLAEHLVGDGVVPFAGGGHGLQHRSAADLRHIRAGEHRTAHRHRGGGEQTLVQQGVLFLALVGVVGHRHDGQSFQHAAEGQQHRRSDDVENGVHDGNAEGVGGLVKEGEVEHRVEAVEAQQENDGADEVEIQVDEGGAPGVFVGARRRDDRRGGGADVLAHDDGHRSGEADRAGGGQHLQNAHRSGGGLQQRREHRARHHAEQRVGEFGEQLHEPGFVGEGLHGAGHGVHAGHEDGKAQQNFAHAAAAVLAGHVQHHADKAQNGAPCVGVEHLGDKAVPLQTGQRQQPAGDGGAHVGAHDDADGLMQVHQTGVDKAHRHDRGGAAGLDDGRDGTPQQQTLDGAGGHFAQNALQFAAGGLLQAFAHQVHAVQEHGDTAHQCEHVENAHGYTSSTILFFYPAPRAGSYQFLL